MRYKSELLEDETQKLSADFQNYKSTKDMLFNELARARQEERDYLTNENLGLQSKVNISEAGHFYSRANHLEQILRGVKNNLRTLRGLKSFKFGAWRSLEECNLNRILEI